jgi:GH24 family phage-related lysozyme (muramidase)
LGGSWAASSIADTATGANKPKVEKHDTGGIVKNTFNLDNFIQNNQSTTKSSLPKWFESANKNKVSTKSSIKINLPKKKKAQSEKPGKDIGGYGEITKLFPDPEGKVSGTGSSQGGAAITSAAQKKAGFNIFNPFSWFSKSTSGPAATTPAAQPPQGSSQPNALFALTKASQSLKKIPFVGYLMGAAVDIAMGQKPDRDLYQTMADSVLYLGQKAAEGQSKEIQTNIQKLAAGGITSIAESSSPISLDAGKVANKTLRDSLAGAIEIGANGALKNVKDEIISADVRGRNSSARTGYDPRYDQPPGTETESGPGGAPPPAPSGGGTTGGISGSGIGKGVSIAKKLMVDLNIKPAAAAGIVGNLMHESSLKPDNVENGKGFEDGAINNIPKGTQRVGYGWGQWTNDRLETFRSFLKGRKADNRPATDDDNYAYLIKELKSSEPIRGHWKGWGGKNIPEEDPKRAATWFMMNWERPSAPHEDSRHDYAVKIFDQIKNVSKDQAKADVQKSGGKIASEQEYTDGSDPRSKDDKKGGSKIGGKSIVDIGKNLISQKFSVAEHPDFSKNPSPSGGSYTPGKGVVSNVHKGRGHYEGRAIDVTDWTSGYPGRYNKVADALQKNSAIKMLIHDKWGFYKDGQKSGPGSYGHPTHLHVETKFHGGLVDKEGLVKIHKNEFVVDADTVKLFGVDFFKSLNSVENKVNLSKVAPDLISRISESIKGSSFTLPQTDQYTKEEDPKSASQNKDSTQITTQNLDKFNKEQETKTEESQQNEKDDKKQTVQVIPANHPETGKGFTIRGVTDGNGRPLILSKGAITAFGEMMQDSKGVVKGSDVASGKRSPAQNKKVGGVKNSNHLGGNALDIHGTSMPWMRKKGKAYGWVVNDYPGSHGGHFDYKGDTKDSEGDTLAAMSSDSIMDSVTDYGNAPSGAGPSGGGESAGGSLGGSNDNANPQQDVDVEPTEELIERKGGGVPKGFKPGAAGSFTTDKGQIDHQSIQRFIMNNEGSIKDSQGRHTRYKDSNGFWTIGFGHLWKEGDPMTMSQEEAEKLFQKDYTSHRKAAESIPGFAKASAAQQAALIDLTFNMGPGWYKEWPSFTKAMKEGKYEKAQAELKDSAWFKQVGVRAPKVIDLIGRSGVPGGPPTKSGEEPPSGDPNKPNSINIGNYTIDTKNDFLKAAGTGKLKYGEGGDGWCTTNVLKGLDKLGHTFAPGGTEGDSSNPRGLVSQLIGDSGFTSIPGLGSEQTIKSPYGNVKARVVPFKDYQAAVEKGLIPSGAFLFSTRYKSWNQQTGGSSGFDTAIAREGGRIAWNGTGSKGNAIYGDATQSVIVLVPRSAIKEKPTQKPGGPAKPGTSAKPGAPAKPGGKPKQNWLQSAASNAVGLLTGKKKLGILKAEGGGQIDSSGIITRPKMRNIESFASYEDPSSSSTHIIIVPSPAKQLPPEKTRGLSGYSSNPSKSSNKYYSPARRK